MTHPAHHLQIMCLSHRYLWTEQSEGRLQDASAWALRRWRLAVATATG